MSGSGEHIGTAQGQAREVNEWVALGGCVGVDGLDGSKEQAEGMNGMNW